MSNNSTHIHDGSITIIADNVSKRYNRDWIFKNFNYNFESGRQYAITGSNGSGKSTLLQVIAGYVMQSGGSLQYNQKGKPTGNMHHLVSVAAPYLELIEEFTALEFLAFHSNFSPFNIPHKEMLAAVNIASSANKQIRYFSSGMKQRLKLAQAFFSNKPVIFLDEPHTNLDKDGVLIYDALIKTHLHKLIIISSNDPQEYQVCSHIIDINQYK